eukprot:jgi/Psemu1/17484/gm1.17484_g
MKAQRIRKTTNAPIHGRERKSESLPRSSQTKRTMFGITVLALIVIVTTSHSFHSISCQAYVPPASRSSIIVPKEKSAARSRRNTVLYESSDRFGRNSEAERLKRKRDELDAKALRQELLSEVREAETARKKIERDIREAEARRRALDEQASVGRNYIDSLQSGSLNAVNAAKSFLDTGVKGKGKRGRPSKLDLERERLELELEQLKSKQKAQETTQLLTTYGGVATALGVAANVLNGNGELGDLGTASGLRQLFPSTSQYLTDLSAKNDNERITSAAARNAGGNVEMPYLDAKIAELEKKVKEERNTVKEEARELDRFGRKGPERSARKGRNGGQRKS